ncbi:MAG: ABC transporter ATP-binding protein [Elusimicrobiota bacterium]|jgi:ABC-type lipoprotein export system ATPase subunit|nr:ABC transporter ATP-binding protein [Elusimicrobiota bacterium]
MSSKKEIILEAKNISKIYYRDDKREIDFQFKALQNINLEILKNEIVCIFGSSGAGKSTLLNILSGISSPTDGLVYLDGNILPYHNDEKMASIRRKKFGFIFQFYNLLSEFTVLENVMLPMMLDAKASFAEICDKSIDLLERLGLKEKLKNFPIQLSGGEKQRVAIARALINDADIIFADEPTGNLDDKNSENIYEILEKIWSEQGTTIIMVSHDKRIKFSKYKTIKLEAGKLIQ